jgi:hypothetical protein
MYEIAKSLTNFQMEIYECKFCGQRGHLPNRCRMKKNLDKAFKHIDPILSKE